MCGDTAESNAEGELKRLLENIITCRCFACKTRSETKLMRLAYLTEVYPCRSFGKHLTDVSFIHQHYDPWAKEISETLEVRYNKELHEKGVNTKAKHPARVPSSNIDTNLREERR